MAVQQEIAGRGRGSGREPDTGEVLTSSPTDAQHLSPWFLCHYQTFVLLRDAGRSFLSLIGTSEFPKFCIKSIYYVLTILLNIYTLYNSPF